MKDYKKILEGLVNIINNTEKSDIGFANICTFIGENCPELKEYEDERIRKEILKYIDKATGCKRWVAWLEKQGNTNIFDVPKISIKNAVEVTSRMQYIDDDIKPIAEFIMDYANWDLHKDEWNQPTLTVPLFRVLDALIQKGKPYCVCNQNIEKQGEQKPADKIEPKFKVGDWCIDNEDGIVFQIVKVLDKTYRYRTSEGKEYSCARYSLELDARLWTISDAKGGDILVDEDDNIGIYYGKVDDVSWHSYVYLGCVIYFHGGGYHIIKNTKPATKEQRDKLEKSMADAGYAFDFDKKKLKKIEQKPTEEVNDEDVRDFAQYIRKLGDDYELNLPNRDYAVAKDILTHLIHKKPALSEEDEKRIKNIISVLDVQVCWDGATGKKENPYQKEIEWLNKLKEL